MEIAWAVVADAAPFLMQFPRQALYGHGNAGQANVERTLRVRSTGRRNLRLLSGAQRRPTRELS